MTVVAVVLIIAGAVFLGISAVGLLRFPDFYTRAHVVAKSETIGIIGVLGGLALLHGWQIATPRILLVVLLALFANPTAVHALGRAAEQAGVEPWRQGGERR